MKFGKPTVRNLEGVDTVVSEKGCTEKGGMGVVFGRSRPTVTKRGSEMGQIEIDKYACTECKYLFPFVCFKKTRPPSHRASKQFTPRAYKPPSGITYRGTHTHNIINTIKTNMLSFAFELGTTDACVYQPYCCQLAERFEMTRGCFFFSKICFQINIVPLFKETFFFLYKIFGHNHAEA